MALLQRERGLSVPLDTGHRLVERPVDGLGHARTRVELNERSVLRAAADNDSIGFRGIAAVFNTRAWIGTRTLGFWEVIAPGAFRKTIQEADVRFLVNHDPNLVLARNRAGTLRLGESEQGLTVDADMAPTTYARDLALLLERGDVSQMSFAFEMLPGQSEWSVAEDGKELLTHHQLRLADVSVVTYPAYEETDAGLRSAGFDRLAARLGLDADQRRRLLVASDDEIDELLPTIAGRGSTDHGPAVTTRDDCPPAGTTGDEPSTFPAHRQLRASRMAAIAEMIGKD